MSDEMREIKTIPYNESFQIVCCIDGNLSRYSIPLLIIHSMASNWQSLQKKIKQQPGRKGGKEEEAGHRKGQKQREKLEEMEGEGEGEGEEDSPSLSSPPPSAPKSDFLRRLEAKMRKRVVGLDCEMVGMGPSGKISALARCSLVDFDGKVSQSNQTPRQLPPLTPSFPFLPFPSPLLSSSCSSGSLRSHRPSQRFRHRLPHQMVGNSPWRPEERQGRGGPSLPRGVPEGGGGSLEGAGVGRTRP